MVDAPICNFRNRKEVELDKLWEIVHPSPSDARLSAITTWEFVKRLIRFILRQNSIEHSTTKTQHNRLKFGNMLCLCSFNCARGTTSNEITDMYEFFFLLIWVKNIIYDKNCRFQNAQPEKVDSTWVNKHVVELNILLWWLLLLFIC